MCPPGKFKAQRNIISPGEQYFLTMRRRNEYVFVVYFLRITSMTSVRLLIRMGSKHTALATRKSGQSQPERVHNTRIRPLSIIPSKLLETAIALETRHKRIRQQPPRQESWRNQDESRSVDSCRELPARGKPLDSLPLWL
jgi:hypothetical protein